MGVWGVGVQAAKARISSPLCVLGEGEGAGATCPGKDILPPTPACLKNDR